MAGFLKTVGALAPFVTVIGWLLVPVITFVVNKLFAGLSVDLEQKLKGLRVCTIPNLKQKLMAVQKQRVLQAARNMGSESDLQKLEESIRSALYDADEVLDLVEYHRIEKKLAGDRSFCQQHLREAVGACIANCKEWFGPSLAAARSRCRQELDHLDQIWREFFAPRGTPEEPSPDPAAPGNPQVQQTSPDLQAQGIPQEQQRSMWHQHLREAVGACIANCKGWFARSLAAVRSRCPQLCDRQQLLPLSMSVSPRRTTEEERPRPNPEAPGNAQEQEQQRVPVQQARQLPDHSEASLNSVLQRLHSCFLAIYNCCRSILSWLAGVIEFLCRLWVWSYEVVGIKRNEEYGIGLNSFQLMIHGKSLRKRMEDIDSTITVLKESPLLNEQSSSTVNVSDKKSSRSSSSVQDKDEESRSRRKEIADMHGNIAQPVFGREKDQGDVSKLLRCKGPSSVIVIHGIAGSGKTALARYVCDHEKKDKYFDLIMFIQVSKTFRLCDIFTDMLMEITRQDGQSSIEDLKSLDSQSEKLKDKFKSVKTLCAELKKNLRGKRYLLVLDDLCVIGGDENEEKQSDILLHALADGHGESRILVTAQNKEAAVALGVCEYIPIRELEPHEYLSLFMRYGLPDGVDDETRKKLESIGGEIAEKLHRLPLAAVTVAKRLRGKSIETWETTANLDVLNETMGALWWSYWQLSPEIRRCFEYCSIFPRGYKFDPRGLVRIWIAQGFLNTSNATEQPEDVGQVYCNELLAFSFFSATPSKGFTIHDLLHDLLERVAGRDFFRIGVNGFDSQQGIPPEVRHLFIETYDIAETTTEQILKLENLRTLIIDEEYLDEEYTAFDDVHPPQDLVKEKLIEGIFKMMRKLRVLIINIKYRPNHEFLISESMGQMKHLRLFSFYPKFKFYSTEQFSKVHPWPPETNLILPSTLTQLYHMQVLEFLEGGVKVSFPEDLADNLIHLRRISVTPDFPIPNIGRLTSLQWMSCFIVKEEEGYELRQLKHLNKLRDRLLLLGLENVPSRVEALQANLAGKTRLKELVLYFNRSNPDVEEDVLESLLPPKDLKSLVVCKYSGSRYPSWMLNRQNPYALKNLDRLCLDRCSPLVDIPEGSEFFAGLRRLTVLRCNWNALPDQMERLRSLKTLDILACHGIEFLPTLPGSLQNILIIGGKLWESFQDEKHPNRERIEHVSYKEFYPPIPGYGVPYVLKLDAGRCGPTFLPARPACENALGGLMQTPAIYVAGLKRRVCKACWQTGYLCGLPAHHLQQAQLSLPYDVFPRCSDGAIPFSCGARCRRPLPGGGDPLPAKRRRPLPGGGDPLPAKRRRPLPGGGDPLPAKRRRPLPGGGPVFILREDHRFPLQHLRAAGVLLAPLPVRVEQSIFKGSWTYSAAPFVIHALTAD